MSYATDDASKHGGRPVELFRYRGTYVNFYYTSGAREVIFQAPDDDEPHTYVPLNMKRSEMKVTTQNDDVNDVTVQMPVSTDLVAIYGFQIAPPALVCTIFRGHGSNFIRYWSGDVENVNVVKGTATIRIPSRLSATLQSDLPNVYYQTPCNNSIFDDVCGVPYGDWSESVTITAIDGKAITLSGVGDLGGQLVGGEVVLPSGERRMITTQEANVVTVNYPFAGAEVSDAITIATGCNLDQLGDCKNRYNNVRRHTGFKFIPPANIFEVGLEPPKLLVADNTCPCVHCDCSDSPWFIQSTVWPESVGTPAGYYMLDLVTNTGVKIPTGNSATGSFTFDIEGLTSEPGQTTTFTSAFAGGAADWAGRVFGASSSANSAALIAWDRSSELQIFRLGENRIWFADYKDDTEDLVNFANGGSWVAMTDVENGGSYLCHYSRSISVIQGFSLLYVDGIDAIDHPDDDIDAGTMASVFIATGDEALYPGATDAFSDVIPDHDRSCFYAFMEKSGVFEVVKIAMNPAGFVMTTLGNLTRGSGGSVFEGSSIVGWGVNRVTGELLLSDGTTIVLYDPATHTVVRRTTALPRMLSKHNYYSGFAMGWLHAQSGNGNAHFVNLSDLSIIRSVGWSTEAESRLMFASDTECVWDDSRKGIIYRTTSNLRRITLDCNCF